MNLAFKDTYQSTQVQIIGKPNGSKPGEVYIRSWNGRERAFRAVKSFVLWFSAAAVSLFIPILHFVLVPLFLLLALTFAAISFRQRSIVLGGKGCCPFCGADFEIIKAAERWPLQDICTACSRHVTIEKA